MLSGAERAAYDTFTPSGASYSGPPRVDYPVLPLQVWGLQYALDVVLESTHPDWIMHEYARIDLPGGPLWIAKDASPDGLQTITSDVPDVTGWVPEIPVPRHPGTVTVTDRSTADRADLAFAYTNPHGEAVEVAYRGKMPTEPSHPRNGNTMGHSRQSLAALLDLYLYRPGGEATMRIGGVDRPIRKLFGLYPMKFLLAQTQGGLAIASYREAPTPGGFTLTRPGDAVAWPTAATESWSAEGGWVRHDGPVTSLRYHFVEGELDRAQVWQVGIPVPVTDVVFLPALPDMRRPFAGTVTVGFAVDIAGQAGHGRGEASCRWDGDVAVVELRPTEPRWFADRPMDVHIRFEGDAAVVRIERVPVPAR